MNKKGFTLVELLVTLAILGIITGISIPLIKNIQYQQKIKQFETYKSSLTAGAKLYNNSYSIDLFGKRRSGCAIISYDELKKRNLLKDIKMKNVKCDTSAIVVTKYLDSFYYKPSLVCISGTTVVYPKNGSPTSAYCPGDGNASMDVGAYPSSEGNFDIKQVDNIKVRIDSATGNSLKNEKKPKVAYLFTTNSTLTDADYNGSWNTLNFGNPKPENEQLNLIKSGEVIQYGIGKITLKDLSGTIYLYVRVNDLYNLSDEKWEPGSEWTTNGEYHYKKIGTYKIDNEKPVVTINELKSQDSSYNTLKANLKTTASDTYTPNSDLKMCTSIDSDTCTTANKFTSTYTSPKEITIGNSFNGTTHNVFTRVMDKAGNISNGSKSNDYILPKSIDVTFNCNGGSGGGSQSFTAGVAGQKFSTTCSRTGYRLDGWKLSASGTSRNWTAASGVADSWINTYSPRVTLYAHWVPKTVTVTFNCNGGTGGGSQTFTYGVSSQSFSTSCSATGYTITGWNQAANGSSGNYGYRSGVADSWINSNSPNITLYAQWRLNVCTITFDKNSGKFNNNASNTIGYFNYNSYVDSSGSTGIRNATGSGSYYNATRDWYHAKSGKEWIKGSETYNQANVYKAQQICTSLGTGDQSVTLRVNWEKNGLKLHYHTNGGSLAAGKKQTCPDSVGSSCNKVCTQYSSNQAECTGAKTGEVAISKDYYAFDSTHWSAAGIADHHNKDEGKLYMTKSGKTATHFYHVGSSSASKKVDSTIQWSTVKDLAAALGKTDALKKGNVDVDIYAEWS